MEQVKVCASPVPKPLNPGDFPFFISQAVVVRPLFPLFSISQCHVMMDHLDSQKANRDNNFNFIRLVLALLVILSHSPQLIDGNESREPLTMLVGFTSLGKMAVECFFLLSGYLIVQSWVHSPHIWSFLKKRILRIYPGFIVASFLCAFVVGPLGAQPEKYFKAFWYGGFVKSVFFLEIPEVPAVFQGQPYPSVNGSMWSISLEFTCYLFVLVLGSLGIFHRKIFWLFLAIGLYVVVLYSTLGLSSPYFHWKIRYSG